jgi:hypothetical protein
MDDLSTFATLLLAAITLATAAGVGFQRGKITKLRGELDEADKRSERLSRELDDTKTKLEQCRTDLDALGRVVTAEAHWTAIGHLLDEHHAEAKEHWVRQGDVLGRIAEIVEAYRR